MRLLFLLAFLIVTCKVNGQDKETDSNDYFSEGYESRLYYSDTVSKTFSYNNNDRMADINQSLFNLPIDRCHYTTIKVVVYVDSSGIARDMKLTSGAGYEKINLQIRDSVLNHPGKWVPAYHEGSRVPFAVKITFYMLNFQPKYRVSRVGLNNTVGYQMRNVSDILKECEDSEYYYNEGIRKFQDENYKSAVQLFKKSLNLNKYDLDALYNQGISYVKMSDIKAACECFSKGDEYGDPAATAALKKHCSEK